MEVDRSQFGLVWVKKSWFMCPAARTLAGGATSFGEAGNGHSSLAPRAQRSQRKAAQGVPFWDMRCSEFNKSRPQKVSFFGTWPRFPWPLDAGTLRRKKIWPPNSVRALK